jgi:hypothetical protein
MNYFTSKPQSISIDMERCSTYETSYTSAQAMHNYNHDQKWKCLKYNRDVVQNYKGYIRPTFNLR